MPPAAHSQIAPPRGIHLWLVSCAVLPVPEDVLIARCSQVERARAARMRVPARGRDFLVGRAILRSVLGAYLGTAPSEIELITGEHGKPFVDGTRAPSFNASHSGDLVAVAVTDGPDIGIDLERVDPQIDVMAIARRFFAAEEVARLASLRTDARVRAFFRLWTRKEAELKASGTGFTATLDDVRGLGENPLTASSRAARTVVDFEPPNGYVGAIAYQGTPKPLHTPGHALACL